VQTKPYCIRCHWETDFQGGHLSRVNTLLHVPTPSNDSNGCRHEHQPEETERTANAQSAVDSPFADAQICLTRCSTSVTQNSK
jgi:hypothetical protein